jgi:DNA-binding CsgD family transcriptional regulator
VIAQKLLAKRSIAPNGCWEWTGYKLLGYGAMRHGGRKVAKVHRIAYELWRGAIPEGMAVCHHCDNPPCFNPGHLFLGTRKDNMMDAGRKGRLSALGSTGAPVLRGTTLSPREFQVAELIAWGQPIRSIAKSLGISDKTAEFHYARLRRRIGARNIADVTRYAIMYGIITLPAAQKEAA